jgi:hypothetical protein
MLGPMEAVEAELRVTEAHYVEAFEAGARKGSRSIVVLLAIVAVATLGLAALTWPVEPGAWLLALPAALSGMWLAPRQARYGARRAYRAVPAAWHAVRLVLDDAQLRVRSDSLESYRPWSHVTSWLETPGLFVLMSGAVVSDVWPKDAFDEASLARVRALLVARLPVHGAPVPRAVDTARIARRVRIVLFAILAAVLIVAYAAWRSAA